MTKPQITFWYEFASTYSYPAAMRVEAAAAAKDVEVVWRPFLLGPVFKAQGWNTSPFNLYPAKGAYMWRDAARICAGLGLAFHRPDPFPQNGLPAARLATFGMTQGWGAEFSRAVYHAEFGEGRSISDWDVLGGLVTAAGGDPLQAYDAAVSEANKAVLKQATEVAMARGIFGAPSFVTGDGELFWGNDRLDTALDWAVKIGK